MATVGRVPEVERLLESLKKQTFKNFELVVVDQNEHFGVADLCEKYKKDIPIVYIHSDVKGLSVNRNIGLKNCSGDIVGYPDDDCYYQSDVLETVSKAFSMYQEITFCALPVYDTFNEAERYIAPKRKVALRKRDVFKYCISFNFFIRRNNEVLFDNRLGVGAKYSSGEEGDYIYSAIGKTGTGRFIYESGIHHLRSSRYMTKDRAYKYGLGFGAMMKKDFVYRKNISAIFSFFYYLLRSFGGMILFPSQFVFYWETFKGRLCGFITFHP
jgi:glycosyltransferase involved in cell wall biosynthesis